ncbi:MAG: 23S rRNA (pseudouridine(1915)-N(3))-methyltransferase RlmH [Acidobacteriota bacterium]
MRVRVVWLGRPAGSPDEGQVETYRRRVQRRWPAEDVALRPAGGDRGRDPVRALRSEADALARQVFGGWKLAALDERGRAHDSGSFARWLGGLEEDGAEGVVFALGSDLGLDQGVLNVADERLSLSPMTLPHLLARLLLWEQLFRATHILGGGAYHRVSVQ